MAGLLPRDTVGWVPEHFYAEVAGVFRHQTVVARKLADEQAGSALHRLSQWHLRHAGVAAVIDAAWRFRHNMTMADALYVALASELGAALFTDDAKLVNSPSFPSGVTVLCLHVV